MTSISKNKDDADSGSFVFLLLFLIYFFSNVVYYVFAVLNGSMIIDGVEFGVGDGLGWSLALTLILLLFQYFIVKIIGSVHAVGSDYSESYRRLLYFSLIYQISFYFYNTIYGYGVAGQAVGQESILKYLFYIISPDLVALIVSVMVLKSRLYYYNLLFLVFSMLSRGWAGGVILMVFVLLINSSFSGIIDILKKSGFKIFLIVVIGVILIPVLNAFKFWVRDGGEEGFTYYLNYILGDGGFFSVVGDSIFYLLSRFSIVGSISIINDHKDMLKDAYNTGAIAPYWSENMLVSSLYRMLSDGGVNASNYIAMEVLGYSDATWNTHVGLAGWLILLPAVNSVFFYFYYLIILLLGLFLSKLLGGRVFSMVSVLSLTYIYHGWFSSYILVVYCLLLIVFFRAVFLRPKKVLVV